MSDMSAMAESGRLLLDNLNLNDGPPAPATGKRMTKRQISAGAYASNTPGAGDTAYEAKFQRLNFLGARKPGVVPKMWSAEEDEMLRKAVEKHGEKNWRVIAQEIPDRNHLQCLQRWKKALRPGLIKGHWSKEEDQHLLDLIKSYTEKGSINNINWTAIAQQIEGRNAKQCRERWFLNLDPSINRGPWTAEEDRRLLELAAQCGGRWSLIAKNMSGRTENAVKTRYHSLQRQEARKRGWLPDEDKALLEASLVFGRDWGKIVKQLPGRSRGQLKKRFAVLTQNKPEHVRQVQIVEDRIAKGLMEVPNPPPAPVDPAGAQVLKENLLHGNDGRRPVRSPLSATYSQAVPPPPVDAEPNWGPSTPPYYASTQAPLGPTPKYESWADPSQQPPKKSMRKFNSSWLNSFMDVGEAPEQQVQMPRSDSRLFDFGGDSSRSLARQENSNMALLDKLLSETGQDDSAGDSNMANSPDYSESSGVGGGRSKGLKNYSSWGSLGGTDIGLFANSFPDTTAGSSTVAPPPVMRSDSLKKLNPMMSSMSNWNATPGNMQSYESTNDFKNIFNLL